jgi:hypothetical protein
MALGHMSAGEVVTQRGARQCCAWRAQTACGRGRDDSQTNRRAVCWPGAGCAEQRQGDYRRTRSSGSGGGEQRRARCTAAGIYGGQINGTDGVNTAGAGRAAGADAQGGCRTEANRRRGGEAAGRASRARGSEAQGRRHGRTRSGPLAKPGGRRGRRSARKNVGKARTPRPVT